MTQVGGWGSTAVSTVLGVCRGSLVVHSSRNSSLRGDQECYTPGACRQHYRADSGIEGPAWVDSHRAGRVVPCFPPAALPAALPALQLPLAQAGCQHILTPLLKPSPRPSGAADSSASTDTIHIAWWLRLSGRCGGRDADAGRGASRLTAAFRAPRLGQLLQQLCHGSAGAYLFPNQLACFPCCSSGASPWPSRGRRAPRAQQSEGQCAPGECAPADPSEQHCYGPRLRALTLRHSPFSEFCRCQQDRSA